jgi:hypothetical protein
MWRLGADGGHWARTGKRDLSPPSARGAAWAQIASGARFGCVTIGRRSPKTEAPGIDLLREQYYILHPS